MKSFRNSIAVTLVAACGVLTAVFAAPPTSDNDRSGNSYHLFTKALHADDTGVVAIPSRFKWSVETSVAGYDLQAQPIADSRVMLRLYDPTENFTAITAQMDLETAEKLQRELADMIAKKRQNPDFHHRPRLYDPSLLPTGDIIGVDENGVACIKQTYPGSNKTEILSGPIYAPEKKAK
ncbi:secreted protein [Rhodopirellula europaea 6C]|uniref:Secreted protein n=2 Tax=Rhodopirellula TaxID=265488 RepID=M2AV65_9BACT|nr:secreted protein [Rhodopirellula europaea 6C]